MTVMVSTYCKEKGGTCNKVAKNAKKKKTKKA